MPVVDIVKKWVVYEYYIYTLYGILNMYYGLKRSTLELLSYSSSTEPQLKCSGFSKKSSDQKQHDFVSERRETVVECVRQTVLLLSVGRRV